MRRALKNDNLIKKVLDLYVFFIHLHSDSHAKCVIVVAQMID